MSHLRRGVVPGLLPWVLALALCGGPARAETSPKGYIEMPAPEDGTYVLTSKPGSGRNWGTPTFVRFLVMVAREWKHRHPEAPILRIGDMSKPDGTTFPPHKTHKDGLTADLFTSPKNICHISYPDQGLTLELAQLLFDLGAKQILYNGEKVVKAVSVAQKWPDHDDHFHVVIDPARVPKDGTVLVMPEPGLRTGDWIARRQLDDELKGFELRWRLIGQAKLKGMRVLFDDEDDANGVLHDSGLIKHSAYEVPVPLEHGKRYRWRVIGEGEDPAPSSSWQTLTADLEPPVVEALGPDDDASLDAVPELRWKTTKQGAAQVRYWVELDKDRNHKKTAGRLGPFAGAGQAHRLDPPPKLKKNGKYFWRVVVEDAHGNEGASGWRAFKTSSAYGKEPGKGSTSSPPEPPARTGVVDAKGLNLRQGPGTTHPVITSLGQGTSVRILKEEAGWLEVEATADGKPVRGWVSAKFIKQ
ncbi:MAG: SH3 domain-containing protein [Planctomycetota bacterium]